MAHSSLRFGIGRFTTEAEIDFVVSHIVRTVNRLRDMRYVDQSYSSILSLKKLQSTVGNGPGGHRYQFHRLVAALMEFFRSMPNSSTQLYLVYCICQSTL